MVSVAKPGFIAAGIKVWRITIKNSVRPIVAGNTVGVIKVLYISSIETFMASVNGSKSGTPESGSAGGTIAETRMRGTTFAAECGFHNKERTGGLLDIC